MKISVIIVSYNVKYFLEQAIFSIKNAIAPEIPTEIIVVDNNSTDGSVDMLKSRFPMVTCIANTHNPGFSIANNQGLKIAKGQYILFLNPDTILSEDTLKCCAEAMDRDDQVGALGVRMVDGSGQFLPESKRGLPIPRVAFFKMIGLHKLFPKSSLFNAYYAGHIDEFEQAEVDVLCGAFMFVRHSILKEIGGFDESFFMYGEDIDLSYRMQQAGYKVIYLPTTNIIHYKGESTKKTSLNYVRHFHQAMLIFADKHFRHGYPFFIRLIMALGVYTGIVFTLLKNIYSILKWPIVDVIVMLSTILIFKHIWAIMYYNDAAYYDNTFFYSFNLPVYILTWLVSLYLAGSYDQPFKLSLLIKGMVWGLLFNGLIYGLLSDPYRPSRAIMVVSFFISTAIMYSIRALHFYKMYKKWPLNYTTVKRLAVVGNHQTYQLLNDNMSQLTSDVQVIGYIGKDTDSTSSYLGELDDLKDICRVRDIDEVVFTMDSITPSRMMALMNKIGSGVTYKMIASIDSKIIGSSDKNRSGEWYALDVKYNLATKTSRRWKYLQDFVFCILAGLLFPFWIIISSRRLTIVKGVFAVISGKYTWLGYVDSSYNGSLPHLKPGIFSIKPVDSKALSDHQSFVINQDYAVNYYPAMDYELFFTALFI